jgi:hypothetical protein
LPALSSPVIGAHAVLWLAHMLATLCCFKQPHSITPIISARSLRRNALDALNARNALAPPHYAAVLEL